MIENPKYKLCVVVVNYNVEYFLDQCLESVYKAANNVAVEIIVVDNNSVDGSLQMVKTKYPECTIIANNENVGFSKANNQAIARSSSEYILLLNPDTVVQEDSLDKIIDFMEANPTAGGLGVRMIDGKGIFLPESKRGLPTPGVAFYKIFGLSSLFPRSKMFGHYHMGHLSESETNQVDILSGAFMLLRKKTLDDIGLLDENFFMYGEDIDLSYRITKGGYKNYYFADTSIIHYKGESTKKSSVNYVFVFYKAMIIFAKKHFTGKSAWFFSSLINLAIYFRATIAICLRFLKRIFLPSIDFLYVVGGLYALTNYWKMSDIEFPEDLIQYSIPIYAATWLATSFFNGGYDYPVKLYKLFKGVFIGTLLIILAYAILPKSLQFSRLFIFVGATWVFLYYVLSRLFLHFASKKRFNLRVESKRSFAVIGTSQEFQRLKELLIQITGKTKDIVHVPADELNRVKAKEFNELIFCSSDCNYKDIIDWMIELNQYDIDFKIAPNNVNHLIGSNSIDKAGELYILNINTLVSKENKRKKRLFDFICSLGLIVISPFIVFFYKRKTNLIKSLFQILIGKKSFIGFSDAVSKKDVRLPKIKPGILSPADSLGSYDESIHEKLNLLYSRDYSMRKDFSILLKSWKKLDK